MHFCSCIHSTLMPCDWAEKQTSQPENFRIFVAQMCCVAIGVWVCQRTSFKMVLRVTIRYCYARNSPLSGFLIASKFLFNGNACMHVRVYACVCDVYGYFISFAQNTFHCVYLCITMFVFILNKLSNVHTHTHTHAPEKAVIEARTTLNPCQTQPSSSDSSKSNSGGKQSHIHHL